MIKIGANARVDSIGDYLHAVALGGFLNKLNSENSFPKTILYNLNPSNNKVFATMTGNFNDEGIKGKVQFGSAWWFLDQNLVTVDEVEKLLSGDASGRVAR